MEAQMSNFSDIPVQQGGSKFDDDSRDDYDDDDDDDEPTAEEIKRGEEIAELMDNALSVVDKVGYVIIERVKCPKCSHILLATHTFAEIIPCPGCGTRTPSAIPVPRMRGDLSVEHYEMAIQAMINLAIGNEKLISPVTEADTAAMAQTDRLLVARCVVRCQRELTNILVRTARALADQELVDTTLVADGG